MKIALIGYGKMGKEIEKIAIERGHSIEMIIDIHNKEELTTWNLRKCDVAIEFTTPESATKNYLLCFEAGIPVVSGTTGWLSNKEDVLKKCSEKNGTFFHASNFSLGVNLFFTLNSMLARLMAPHNNYNVEITEAHHIQKLDSPSGTAIILAEQLIENLPAKNDWINKGDPEEHEILIHSQRTGSVPGTHTIKYESEVDTIEITHCAKNRKGLALGAVLAAEYCQTHKGILTMKDMLKI